MTCGVSASITVAEQADGEEEYSAGSEGKKKDGVPIGPLCRRWCSCGVIATLGTTLSFAGRGLQQTYRKGECAEEATKHGYWKNASKMKRKSHRTPMACQYQAVQSTRICRVSRSREA